MTYDYRALCAELIDAYAWCIDEFMTAPAEEDTLIQRARALLAQPVAEEPTDEELLASVRHFYGDQTAADMGAKDDLRTARAVLARWGRPTPQPEGGDIHYNWELHDAEGEWQAGGSAITLESVRREGNHYLQTYSQDGPHTLIIYRASTIEEVTND